jgi:uridine phosphorylase
MALLSPRDWINYAAKARGVEVDVGDMVVLTPIKNIFELLLKHFKPAPWEKWIYKPEGRWGLWRSTVEGLAVSFTHTGVGAPELAFIEELAAAGASHFVFLGLAGGLGEGIEVGDLIVPTGGVCEDGFSQHYVPYGIAVDAKDELVELMLRAVSACGLKARAGRVWSISAPYRELEWKAVEYHGRWSCVAVEMEVCGLYALCKYLNAPAVALLAVSDIVYPLGRRRFGFHEAKLSSTVNELPKIVEKYLFLYAELGRKPQNRVSRSSSRRSPT